MYTRNRPLTRSAFLTGTGEELTKRGLEVAGSQHFVTDIVKNHHSIKVGQAVLAVQYARSCRLINGKKGTVTNLSFIFSSLIIDDVKTNGQSLSGC